MLDLLRAWFYKIRHTTLIYLSFILVSVCTVLFVVVANRIATGELAASAGQAASLLTDVIISSSIFGPLVAANFLCKEFSSRDIHVAIRRKNGRMSYVVSKALALIFVEFIVILPYVLMTIIPYVLEWKFQTPFVSSQFLLMLYQHSAGLVENDTIAALILRLLLIILVFAAQTSISLPFAFAIKKPVLVTAVCMVVPFILNAVTGLGKNNKVIEAVFRYTPFNPKASFITFETESGDLWIALVSSIAFIAVMSGLAYLIFRKAEIK